MRDKDCLFCRIIAGEIPAKILFQDEHVFVFNDINPQAPVHILLVPKHHLASVNEIDDSNAFYVGKMFEAAKMMAASLNIAEKGYRLVANTGPGVGQSVAHLHLHLLGGRPMTWPPG